MEFIGEKEAAQIKGAEIHSEIIRGEAEKEEQIKEISDTIAANFTDKKYCIIDDYIECFNRVCHEFEYKIVLSVSNEGFLTIGLNEANNIVNRATFIRAHGKIGGNVAVCRLVKSDKMKQVTKIILNFERDFLKYFDDKNFLEFLGDFVVKEDLIQNDNYSVYSEEKIFPEFKELLIEERAKADPLRWEIIKSKSKEIPQQSQQPQQQQPQNFNPQKERYRKCKNGGKVRR